MGIDIVAFIAGALVVLVVSAPIADRIVKKRKNKKPKL